MPANQLQTSKRRITFPVQLLDQGQEFTSLQQALTFLEFDLDERELEDGRFGRTTRTRLTSNGQGVPS